MEQDEQKVVGAFRERFAYDRGLGRLKPVEHYARVFKGFEDVVAREYARLAAEPAAPKDAPPAVPASSDTPLPAGAAPGGQVVGGYRILREIGRGGQATVYVAEDTRLPRKVALKVFAPGLMPPPQFLARFRREADAASRLDHPSICTVYEAGVDRDTPWIAMRYVEGRTLAQWIDDSVAAAGAAPRTSSLDLPSASASPGDRGSSVMRIVSLVEKTARALHAAHGAGLVHRDVKPGNVIVTREGDPVLLDFGLAREDDHGHTLTMTGALLGTPAYMSPEQLLAQRVPLDCRTDVYSLGVTLYECLTLKRPFDAPTREALYQRILASDADPPRRLNPQIPRDLEVVLATAMEKNRDRRYQTALDFAEDLRRLREHEPIRARPTPALVRVGRWTQRHPAVATGIVAAFAALAFGFGVTLHFLSQSREEQRRTQSALDDRTAALRHAQSLALIGASRDAQASNGLRALLFAREAHRVEPSAAALDQLRTANFKCLERVDLAGHKAALSTAVFSPAGDRILTASADGTARLWDPEGRQIAVLKGHAKPLNAAAFSPDGEHIVTASDDGTARVWDLDGRTLAVLTGHKDDVRRATFSPRGDLVVTASADRTARIWDLAGKELAVLRGHTAGVAAAEFSPGGDRIATASGDRTARLWDLSGQQLAVLTGHEGPVGCVAFTPDGERVVTASTDLTARVWDLAGRELAVLKGHTNAIRSLAVSPLGDRVATAANDKTARIWDLAGTEVAVLQGHEHHVLSVAFSASGDRVVTAAVDSTARLWDLTGRALAVFTGHEGVVFDAAFSPSGERVLTAAADGTARLFELAGREAVSFRGHEKELWWAEFSPRGDRISTASFDGTARVWDLTGKELAVLRGHDGWVFAASISRSGNRVVTSSADKTVRLWDVSGSEIAVLRAHTAPVQTVEFSPFGDRIASGASDNTGRVWDDSGKELATLKGHTNWIRRLAFSPKGDRIATASADGTVRLWDLAGTEVGALNGRDKAYCVAWSPRGDRLVTACEDRTAKVWDASGRRLAVLTGHDGSVFAAAFSPDGERIVTASRDQTARIWDTSGRQISVLKGHDAFVRAAAFSPDGSLILTASDDCTAQLWFASADDLLRSVEARVRATRGLTRAERVKYAELLGQENADILSALRAVERLAPDCVLVAELTAAIRADASLSDGAQTEALRVAAARVDDPNAINASQWDVVKAPGKSPGEYGLAVRRLEAAVKLAPDDGNIVNSLGVGQYRAESYADAVATLVRSDAINAKAHPPGIAADVAFLAMAHHRAGHAQDARTCLVRLRALMLEKSRYATRDDDRLVAEAEALVAGD